MILLNFYNPFRRVTLAFVFYVNDRALCLHTTTKSQYASGSTFGLMLSVLIMSCWWNGVSAVGHGCGQLQSIDMSDCCGIAGTGVSRLRGRGRGSTAG